MNRRALLRIAAAGLGGSAATAAGLSVATGGAAQTGLTLDVAGDSAEIGTDGSVTAVTLDCDIEWAYDLPDATAPATVVVEVAAGTDGDVTVVGSAESSQLFVEADGTERFDVGLISQGAIAASDVEPDGTGERETDVVVEARLRVENASGDVLAKETTSDTATLTVSRDGVEASEYGAVGGSGSLTISTELPAALSFFFQSAYMRDLATLSSVVRLLADRVEVGLRQFRSDSREKRIGQPVSKAAKVGATHRVQIFVVVDVSACGSPRVINDF